MSLSSMKVVIFFVAQFLIGHNFSQHKISHGLVSNNSTWMSRGPTRFFSRARKLLTLNKVHILASPNPKAGRKCHQFLCLVCPSGSFMLLFVFERHIRANEWAPGGGGGVWKKVVKCYGKDISVITFKTNNYPAATMRYWQYAKWEKKYMRLCFLCSHHHSWLRWSYLRSRNRLSYTSRWNFIVLFPVTPDLDR